MADPLAPENILKSSGRGIFLIRSFMDDVELRRAAEGGMEIRMTKRKLDRRARAGSLERRTQRLARVIRPARMREDIPDLGQPGPFGRIDRLGQQQVQHRRLIDDHQVGVQRRGGVERGLPARPQLEQAARSRRRALRRLQRACRQLAPEDALSINRSIPIADLSSGVISK